MAKPEDQTPLVDPMELLLRKVHPSQIKDGRPSKTTFLPRPSDDGMLSVDRSAVISAEECYRAYAATKSVAPLTPGGIWAVTVSECSGISLECLTDPLNESEPGGPNPAHALVDMRELGEEDAYSAAATLFSLAKARGRLAP